MELGLEALLGIRLGQFSTDEQRLQILSHINPIPFSTPEMISLHSFFKQSVPKSSAGPKGITHYQGVCTPTLFLFLTTMSSFATRVDEAASSNSPPGKSTSPLASLLSACARACPSSSRQKNEDVGCGTLGHVVFQRLSRVYRYYCMQNKPHANSKFSVSKNMGLALKELELQKLYTTLIPSNFPRKTWV